MLLLFETFTQCAVADHDEAHVALPATRRIDRFQTRDDVEKHLVVLDLGQTSDDADQKRVVGNAKFVTKLRAPLAVFGEDAEIQTQRHDAKLLRPSHANLLADLGALLFAHDYQSIGDEPRQQSFDREKQLRTTAAVVAVKNVTVIRVHKLAFPRFADQRAGR